MEELNTFEMLNGLGAGLAIFFFGVYEMTLGMREAAADRLRAVLERFTKNRVSAVITGAGTTAIVGSSSMSSSASSRSNRRWRPFDIGRRSSKRSSRWKIPSLEF